ncbi:hypothetical protein [Reyranella sp.]|uniref:hypothetical protein n=1 Tax=Reyranella sp. TaxID=1929291 RepID=UPI003D11704F
MLKILVDGPDNLVLEHLQHIRAGMDEMRDDMRDLKRRLTSLEVSVSNLRGEMASLHGDFAGQSGRIDRIETRLERIERRLELHDAWQVAEKGFSATQASKLASSNGGNAKYRFDILAGRIRLLRRHGIHSDFFSSLLEALPRHRSAM